MALTIDPGFAALATYNSHMGTHFIDAGTISLAEASLVDTPGTPESLESSPSPQQEEKKPAKKRKSWGQELPTPKTNLPPRKRAKTEDEKEQRRVERVLRNRQAAQSSRERKRLEVEKLENEKKTIEEENRILRDQLLRVVQRNSTLEEKLRALGQFQSGLPSPSLTAERLLEKPVKLENDDFVEQMESFTQQDLAMTPRSTSFHSESPVADSHDEASSLVSAQDSLTLDWELMPGMVSRRNSLATTVTSTTTDCVTPQSANQFDQLDITDFADPSRFFEEGMASRDQTDSSNVDIESFFNIDHASSDEHLMDHHEKHDQDGNSFLIPDDLIDFDDSHQSATMPSFL